MRIGVDWGEYFGTEDPDEIDNIMYEESLYAIENSCEEKEETHYEKSS